VREGDLSSGMRKLWKFGIGWRRLRGYVRKLMYFCPMIRFHGANRICQIRYSLLNQSALGPPSFSPVLPVQALLRAPQCWPIIECPSVVGGPTTFPDPDFLFLYCFA
jgi:hypothetical protein